MAGSGAARGLGAFLAALAVQGVAQAGALPSEIVSCGQAVDHSLRVANDLVDCPGDGLVVSADGITIDLGGHRIDGDGMGIDAGVRNQGHVGVTIRSGTVTGFDFGVYLVSNAQAVVVDVQAFHNAHGILVSNSSGRSIVKRNVVSRNSVSGLRVFGSTQTVFQSNTAVGNLQGIVIDNAEGATFVKNRVSGNDADGVYFSGADITFKRNVVSGNGGDGIRLVSSPGSRLVGNVVSANGSDGIALLSAPDNALEANLVSGNVESGIRVEATSTGNLLKGNVARENGAHGISSDTSNLTLLGNRVDRNGFLGGGAGDDVGLGISVPAGTTNAGNQAAGNDDPHECQPADLGCFVP